MGACYCVLVSQLYFYNADFKDLTQTGSRVFPSLTRGTDPSPERGPKRSPLQTKPPHLPLCWVPLLYPCPLHPALCPGDCPEWTTWTAHCPVFSCAIGPMLHTNGRSEGGKRKVTGSPSSSRDPAGLLQAARAPGLKATGPSKQPCLDHSPSGFW